MHGVIETAIFLRDAERAGIADEMREAIVDLIAWNPMLGDVMPGTGGARKLRMPGRGKGKSGGYRVVTYFAGKDVPILMLGIINKGERSDLSQAEKNELRRELAGYADDYKASVAGMIARVGRKGDTE